MTGTAAFATGMQGQKKKQKHLKKKEKPNKKKEKPNKKERLEGSTNNVQDEN